MAYSITHIFLTNTVLARNLAVLQSFRCFIQCRNFMLSSRKGTEIRNHVSARQESVLLLLEWILIWMGSSTLLIWQCGPTAIYLKSKKPFRSWSEWVPWLYLCGMWGHASTHLKSKKPFRSGFTLVSSIGIVGIELCGTGMPTMS